MKKLAILLTLLLPCSVFAASYEIDPTHTAVQFSVRHLMVSNVKGAFSDVSGTVEYDAKNIANTKIEATIQSKSIDTNLEKRDEHLRSPDFFDVVKFPTLSFKSTKIEVIDAQKVNVIGNLTLHGVTKSVTLEVSGITNEVVDPWGNTKVGASATTKINRKDFGLTWNKALEAGGVAVGEEVLITIDVELTKKK
jgi:polyisoprenoid-binding protein YceI